jgi:hypothetical protein
VAVLVLASLALRILVLHDYALFHANDSRSYLDLASALAHLDFNRYDGSRTPIYPLLLLLGRLNDARIQWIQLVLGTLNAVLLYAIAFTDTGRRRLALVVGLSYGLSIAQISLESSLLTETLSAFLILCTALALQSLLRSGNRLGLRLLYTSTAASLAALTRPLLLVVPLLLSSLYFLPWSRRSFLRLPPPRVGSVLCLLCPMLVLLFGWAAFNFEKLGYPGLTTLTGFSLTQHSGAFIEDAPDRYATIRDVYLQFRAKQIQKTGAQTMTIWFAAPALMQTTGASWPELSKSLTRMSLGLFVRHPLRYAASVFRSWLRFWDVRNYWRWDRFRTPAVAASLRMGWRLEHGLALLLNWTFLLIVLAPRVSRYLRRRAGPASKVAVCMVLVVLATSIGQACVEYGENCRYAMPVLPLVQYVVLVSIGSRWGAGAAARRGS